MEPLEFDVKVVREIEDDDDDRSAAMETVSTQVNNAKDSPIDTKLSHIHERELIGSYSKGLIPIRSASFGSSSSRYRRPNCTNRRKSEVYSASNHKSPEITVQLIDEGEEDAESAKLNELLMKFDLEKSKLTRAASESKKKERGRKVEVPGGEKDECSLPEYLHLEAHNRRVGSRQSVLKALFVHINACN